MKKLITGLLVFGICYGLFGQGTVLVRAGARLVSKNGAYIVFNNMHLVNNGSIQHLAGDGVYKFTGNSNVNLSGSGTTTLNRLLLSKAVASELALGNDLSIISEIDFQGGLLNLGDYHVYLDGTGLLANENELSRAYTTEDGYLESMANLVAPVNANPGLLGAVISAAGNPGNTTIRRGHKIQTGLSGATNSIRRYYDIIATNTNGLQPNLRIYYFDAELNGTAENTLNIWKSKDNASWAFVGHNSRDDVSNYAEKLNIGNLQFTRWTLGAAFAPSITCPDDITLNDGQGKCEILIDLSGVNGATATGSPDPVITYSIDGNPISSPYLFPKGTTTVTVTASNGIAPDAVCTFDVTVTCNKNARVIDVQPKREVPGEKLSARAFPNPFTRNFILTYSGNKDKPVSIRVVNALGRIMEERVNLEGSKSLTIGDYRYRQGVYFVEVRQGDEKVVLKMVLMSD